MKFVPTPLPGLWVVQAQPTTDERGSFARLFCEATFRAAGIDFTPTQLSLSTNRRAGTLRGMHWQDAPHAERKLVRALRGRAFDAVVDLRGGSPTRGRWFGLELDAVRQNALLIPAGLAHGFLTLEDDTELLYAMDTPHAPQSARGARWDDPAFGIAWPAAPQVMAERDRQWPAYAAEGQPWPVCAPTAVAA